MLSTKLCEDRHFHRVIKIFRQKNKLFPVFGNKENLTTFAGAFIRGQYSF